MDGDAPSSLWSKFAGLFIGRSEDTLEQAILEAKKEGALDSEAGSMLLSILKLSDMEVQDLMTPRTDIDCLPIGTSVRNVAISIKETGHSRLPIYDLTRDNIVGIVYAKDLIPQLLGADRESLDMPVDSMMRTPYFVPETKCSAELLQDFRARKSHIAIVVDEYGGTSGLITIEDLLEVIVGDIEDEHDAPKEIEIEKISDNEYILSGRSYLEDLETIGLTLTSDEVDTLGGYISLEAGRVPNKEESFQFEGWDFIILEADAKQIHKVIMKRPKSESDTDNDE